MNKSNKTFLVTAIILVAFYLLSAILTLGTVFAPSTAWQIKTQNPDRDNTYQNAFVNIDVSTSKPDPEKEDSVVTANISKIFIYVYIKSHQSKRDVSNTNLRQPVLWDSQI